MTCDDAVKNRIKRIEGQVRGILGMVENQSKCEDVVTQLKAIRSGVDRLIGLIATQNLKQEMEKSKTNDLSQFEDAFDLIVKSIG